MIAIRKNGKNQTIQLEEINRLIREYHEHSPNSKCQELNKKIRAWLRFHGNPTARNMSGFKAFIIENTKIELPVTYSVEDLSTSGKKFMADEVFCATHENTKIEVV